MITPDDDDNDDDNNHVPMDAVWGKMSCAIVATTQQHCNNIAKYAFLSTLPLCASVCVGVGVNILSSQVP
jgi:hypothetical protein